MKKKFVAGLCAFALALAMPAAALADISPEISEDNGTTTIDFGEAPLDGVIENIVVEGAENVTINDFYNIQWSNYDSEALEKYWDKIDQVIDDKGLQMTTFELNGDVTGKKAVVTFQLDADEYGNKVVTYYILHENGDIQEKVVRVHADGTVTIWMESFSIITFMDVDGITKYENMVQPQDGDLLSPKTGC